MKSTPITLTVIGNGESELGSSFLLTMEKNRYLFNIPEGVQRTCMEYKLKLPRLTKILFTSSNWSCWGGYPGSLMTYYATEFPKTPSHSPSDLFSLIDSSNLLPPTSVMFKEVNGITFDSAPFNDDCLSFIPVVTECDSIKTINYHILLPTFLGKFDGAKANALKIPGPLRSKLSKGESVQLADGTTIHQSDVCAEPTCPGYVVILHLPTPAHVDEYLKNELQNDICCIVAIVSDEVKIYQPFKNFMEKHSKALILCLKDRICSTPQQIVGCSKKTTFRMSNELHAAIGSVLPQNAPQFVRTEMVPFDTPKKDQTSFENAPSLVQYSIYPKVSFTSIKRENQFILPQITPLNTSSGQKFQVILLGTGGAVPGKSRNVSGEILKFNKTTIMIDCGECISFHALNAGINPDDIDLLYLTHGHGDHIFGVMSLIKMRTKPLTVVGPKSMENGFKIICEHDKLQINYIINSIFSEEFASSPENQTIIQNIELMIGARMKTVQLNHQIQNYGVRFEMNETSVVFTGDTVPCENDVKLCMNAEYVIHECNFEDGMEEEAIARTHSTPTQIAAALKNCNNKIIILNHIGQRTSKFADIMNKEFPIPMIYSFDGMVFDETIFEHWKQYKECLCAFFSLNEIEEEEED